MNSLPHAASRPSSNPSIRLPLVDRFQRVHRAMRISVTDVCNIRCQYCMPDGDVKFLSNDSHLTFSQIAQVVRVSASFGVESYRLTGGEPLIRPGLHELVAKLLGIPGVRDVALTTNGMMLRSQLPQLVAAGLGRVNISLDTLSEETFKRLSRRSGLHQVLDGIEAALSEPKLTVRLNALVLRDVNIQGVVELVQFAKQRRVTMRFIEFMPLDAERAWSQNRLVTGHELRQILSQHFGPLTPIASIDPAQPASDYSFEDGSKVGFVDSVSAPFCSRCDRLRLTSDGKLRNCLFGKQEWDLKMLLNQSPEGGSVELERQIELQLRDCIQAKMAAHGIDDPLFQPPARAMYQIGG
jgi:GTP 3',8-cyclase